MHAGRANRIRFGGGFMSSFLQAFKIAFTSLRYNKMRSFLTMLGIIIGVFAVTVLIGLVQGTTSQVTSQIEGMGTNLFPVHVFLLHEKWLMCFFPVFPQLLLGDTVV